MIKKILCVLTLVLVIALPGRVCLADDGQSYSAPGTYRWTAPQGASEVTVEVWGGGGAGGWSDGGSVAHAGGGGGGGGGGAYGKGTFSVTPGSEYVVTVGAGGGAFGGNSVLFSGGDGGTSSFASFISASGGKGGCGGGPPEGLYTKNTECPKTFGGAGGTSSAPTNIPGGSGGSGGISGSAVYSGSGGSGGNGGAGGSGSSNASSGGNGQAPGGGGGGYYDGLNAWAGAKPGNGAPGRVVISYSSVQLGPLGLAVRPVCQTNLKVSKIPYHESNVLISSSVQGAENYEFYRSTSSSGGFTKIGENAEGKFTDGPYTQSRGYISRDYYYKVQATSSRAAPSVSSVVFQEGGADACPGTPVTSGFCGATPAKEEVGKEVRWKAYVSKEEGQSYSFAWSGDTGRLAGSSGLSDEEFATTYDTTGKKKVSVKVNDNTPWECSADIVDKVDASCQAAPSPAKPGEPVRWTASPADRSYTYAWEGEGLIVSKTDPYAATAFYPSPVEDKEVRVTVTTSDGIKKGPVSCFVDVRPVKPPNPYRDIGLRVAQDGRAVRIAVWPAAEKSKSPLRIYRNPYVYGVVLVDKNDSHATKVLIKTSGGVRALREYTED